MTKQPESQDTILARYVNGPTQLETAIAGLAEGDLNLAASPDTWTIRQIVHHIVDGDDLWQVCIKAALGNNTGFFSLEWYWDKPQDTWVESWNYAGRPIAPSLALFHANRHHVVQLVQKISGAWEQSIRVRWSDGTEERVTVGDVIEDQAGHTLGHIDDIARIREAHSV